MVVMENYDTPVQAVEPFLWTFGDGTAVLLSSLLLLLLFSDLPKMTPVTPYQLIRTTKKKWLLDVCAAAMESKIFINRQMTGYV